MSQKENLFDLESKTPDSAFKQPDPDNAKEVNGELRPKPRLSDRISKKIIFVFVGFLCVLFYIYFDSLNEVDAKKQRRAQPDAEVSDVDNAEKEDQIKTSKAAPKDLTEGLYDDTTGKRISTLVKPEKAKPVVPGTEQKHDMFAEKPADAQVPSINEARRTDGKSEIPANGRARGEVQLTPAEIAKQAELDAFKKYTEDRLARMAQARANGLGAFAYKAKGGTQPENRSAQAGGNPAQNTAENSALQAQYDKMIADQRNTVAGNAQAGAAGGGGGFGGVGSAAAIARGSQSSSDQDEKAGFVKNAGNEADYHPYSPKPARSPNEVKVGSYVQMILAQGMNSDLPGQITARVREDVWDSVTGCRLLIPAMTTVIGRYDSKVAPGQTRNLASWNHMIFSNGDELNLGSMQAYDMSGSSGMEADVDNHFWKLFGLTLGMSTVTATVQAAVPQQNNSGNTVQNPGQLLQQQIAQQYGQLGAQIIGKYLAVQPTLKNYPGERFMITVPRTIILNKVWRNRCTG